MNRHVALIVIILSSMIVSAMPARRGGKQVQQACGQEITVYQHGDEHFHWLTNERGEWIRRTPEGNYVVIPSLSDNQIIVRRESSPMRISQLKRMTQRAFPTNLAKEGLIILVNFKDIKFETTKAEIDSMYTGLNYTRHYTYDYIFNRRHYTGEVNSQGSARQYFYDMSYGQYNPRFHVIGPVTISQNRKYYGENQNDADKHAEVMIKEACEEAAKQGVDFSIYDNDHDGEVDFVYILYAGEGEADGGPEESIWPHSWGLKDAGVSLKLNGKTINTYACSNEMNSSSGVHDGVATFCHEFSHVLGLPDIYETTGNGLWKTSGEWDVMDYGPYNNEGNTPPAYSGYERFFLGWVTPRVLSDSENVVLNELNSSKEVLLLTTTGQHNLIGNDPNPNTFWVLENRQQKGWDEYVPGHGMLITKITYSYNKWYDNAVNNSEKNMCVDIIEADGKAPEYDENNGQNGWFGKLKDAFPSGATSFNGVTGYPINNIHETDGVITFTVGDVATDLQAPVGHSSTAHKSIYNGQITILRDGIRYNLLGTRL